MTNFYKESNTLYVQQSAGIFRDGTRQAELREPSFNLLGFGTQFLDAQLDGHPDLVIALRWPSGTTTYYAHCQQYWEDWQRGRLPFFPRGVNLEHIPNDGSADWADLRSRVLEGAVHSSEAPF